MNDSLRFALFVVCACICLGTVADASYQLHLSHAHADLICAGKTFGDEDRGIPETSPRRCSEQEQTGEPWRLEIILIEALAFATAAIVLKSFTQKMRADLSEGNT